MIEWDEIKRWQPAKAGMVSDQLARERKRIQGNQAEIESAATPKEWDSPAADAARASLRKLRDRLEDHVARIAALLAVVDRSEDAIRKLQRAIEDAEALAAEHEFGIGEDGTVFKLPSVEAADLPDDVVATRRKVKAELDDTVPQILRRAVDVDTDLKRVMDDVMAGAIDDGDAKTLASAADEGTEQGTKASLADPPKNAGPAEVKAWWDTLSKAERDSLIKHRTEWVGSTNGVPVVDRDKANRIRLEEKRSHLESRRKELKAKLRDAPGPLRTGDHPETRELKEQLAAVDGKISGLNAIEKKLDSTEGRPESERHFLIDVAHSDNGQAVVAKGNPDIASNTATYVPGTGGGLDNIGSDLGRGDAMHRAAGEAGSGDTAVVTWMGYDAPQSVATEATQEKWADGAKDDLANFQEGLRATHDAPGTSTNTLVGHSYGTTVIGHTLRDNPDLNVDQAIMVASPGTGVDHARELNIGTDNVYATTADNDMIHATPQEIHNKQPIVDEYGAKTFESDAGTEGSWYTGGYSQDAHSEYWDPYNKALDNMGRIIAGGEPR